MLHVTGYKLYASMGMTLIELLVVIAIVFIMIGLILTTDPRPSVELDQAARQLVADLRHAQNMAMASEVHDYPDGSSRVPYSYGIGFVANDNFYEFRTTDVEPGIGIIPFDSENITMNNSGSIYFIVPDGHPCREKDIQIKHTNGSTKTIYINPNGNIEIF